MHWWDWVGLITGIVGLALAILSHWREAKVRGELAQKKSELEEALASLKRAREFMNS